MLERGDCNSCGCWRELGTITGRIIGVCLTEGRRDPPNTISDFTGPNELCECFVRRRGEKKGAIFNDPPRS